MGQHICHAWGQARRGNADEFGRDGQEEAEMKLTLCLILAGLSSLAFPVGMASNMDILSWSVVPL